jgi:hypothetical protein
MLLSKLSEVPTSVVVSFTSTSPIPRAKSLHLATATLAAVTVSAVIALVVVAAALRVPTVLRCLLPMVAEIAELLVVARVARGSPNIALMTAHPQAAVALEAEVVVDKRRNVIATTKISTTRIEILPRSCIFTPPGFWAWRFAHRFA